MHHTMGSATRRSILRSGLRGGVLLTLAAVSPVRTLLGDEAAAKKNTGKKPISIAKRANFDIGLCFELGGNPEVVVSPGKATVTCTQDDGSSMTCTYTKNATRCTPKESTPGDLPDLASDPFYPNPGDLTDVPLEPVEDGVTITSAGGGKRTRHRRGPSRRR